MKNIIKFTFAIIVAIACIACNKENSPIEEVEYVYAKVDFSGDISIQPLETKASTAAESFEEGDILLLNVVRYKDDSFHWLQSVASVQGGIYTDVNNIIIPMLKGAESLNAATACSVVLWEMNKDRKSVV